MAESAANDGGKSIRVELDPDLARSLDTWRRQQESIPSTAAAVRRLLARALVNDGAMA